MRKFFRWGFVFAISIMLGMCLVFGSNAVEAQSYNSFDNSSLRVNLDNSLNYELGAETEDSELDPTLSVYSLMLNSYSDYLENYVAKELDSQYCLRDDYLIYADMQNPYGLCWAFAAGESLTTTIMKATNEYIDVSEGWISLIRALGGYEEAYELDGFLDGFKDLAQYLGLSNLSEQDLQEYKELLMDTLDDYLVGEGGQFVYFDMIARAMGIVSESDFDYDIFGFAGSAASDTGNLIEYYNYYSQFVNKEIMNDVSGVRFGTMGIINDLDDPQRDDLLNLVKYHIKNSGSVYCGMQWRGVSEVEVNDKNVSILNIDKSTPTQGGHAVSIIGWDDTFTATGDDGEVHNGAWIVLNSWGDYWGDDGIFYIFYDCTDFNDCLRGYVYEKDESDTLYTTIDTSKVNPDAPYADPNINPYVYGYVETDKKGSYYGSFNSENNSTLQRNMFYSYDVDLTYNYTISGNATIDRIIIYNGTADRTSLFTISNESENQSIHIMGEDLDLGTYKVVIEYHLAEDPSNMLTNVNYFSVLDGTEIGFIYANLCNIKEDGTLKTITDSNVAPGMGRFFTHNNFTGGEDTLILPVRTLLKDKAIAVYYFYTTYGIQFDKSSYCKAVAFDINASSYGEFTVESELGRSRTYKVKIYQVGTNDKLVNVKYDTNGGINDEDNLSRMLVRNGMSAQIKSPTREGYRFLGWYTSPDFNEESKLTKLGNMSLLTSANFSSMNVLNYNTKNTSDSDYNYYNESNVAFLFAKWEQESQVQVNIDYNGKGGTNYSITATIDDKLTAPAVSEVAGYAFDGWYTDSGFTTQWNFESDTVSGAMTLYAKWRANIYTVNYRVDGEVKETIEVEYNTKAEEISPSKAGYTFLHWSTSSTKDIEYNFNTPVVSDLDLYAVFDLDAPKNVKILLTGKDISTTSVSLISLINYKFSADFSHNIKDSLTTSYTWKVDDILELSNASFINKRFLTAGNHSIELQITISDGKQTKSESITGNVRVEHLSTSEISISRTSLNVEGLALGAKYNVRIYKLLEGYEVTSGSSVEGYKLVDELNNLENLNVDLSSYTNASGDYKVCVDKTVESLTVENALTENFEVVSLSYSGAFNELDRKIYLDKGTNVKVLDEAYNGYNPSVAGHNFLGWFSDKKLTKKISSFTIGDDTILYAKWEIVPIITLADIDSESSLISTYDKNKKYTLSVNSDYNKTTLNCAYEWYKEGVNLVVSNQKDFKVHDCVDSGTYYCKSIFTDSIGLKFEVLSNSVDVRINKQKITIKADDVASTWMFGKKDLSYQIVSDYTGSIDELKIKLSCDVDTSKIGTYDIHVTIDNPNFELTEIAGVYEVSAFGLIFAGVGVAIVILAVVLVVKKVKQRY